MGTIIKSLIAIVLLVLYVFSVVMAIFVVLGHVPTNNFTAGMEQVIGLVGGLVSALVIVELAITDSGKLPTGRTVGATENKPFRVVVMIYIIVWVVVGLSAFVFGPMLHPSTLPPLTSLGQEWLGLAISAAYAYFGIKPTATTVSQPT